MIEHQTHDSDSAVDDLLTDYDAGVVIGTGKGAVTSQFRVRASGWRTAMDLTVFGITEAHRSCILSVKLTEVQA